MCGPGSSRHVTQDDTLSRYSRARVKFDAFRAEVLAAEARSEPADRIGKIKFNRDEAEMEMMKMQQRAGFKLHACRQKRDEEISAAVRQPRRAIRMPRVMSCRSVVAQGRGGLLTSVCCPACSCLSGLRAHTMVVWWPPQLAAHWAQTSQLLASGAAVCRSFYDDRERAFAAQSAGARE